MYSTIKYEDDDFPLSYSSIIDKQNDQDDLILKLGKNNLNIICELYPKKEKIINQNQLPVEAFSSTQGYKKSSQKIDFDIFKENNIESETINKNMFFGGLRFDIKEDEQTNQNMLFSAQSLYIEEDEKTFPNNFDIQSSRKNMQTNQNNFYGAQTLKIKEDEKAISNDLQIPDSQKENRKKQNVFCAAHTLNIKEDEKATKIHLYLPDSQKENQSNSNNNLQEDALNLINYKNIPNFDIYEESNLILNSNRFDQKCELYNNYDDNILNNKEEPQHTNANNFSSNFKQDESLNQNNNIIIKESNSNQSDEIIFIIKPTEKEKKKEKKKKKKIIKEIIEVKENKHKSNLGRKTLLSNEEGNHGKDGKDNLLRQSKHIIIEDIVEFINEKINLINLYVKINGKEFKANLLNISPKIKYDITVKTNKDLFETPLKYILIKFNGNYKIYQENFNEIIINGICQNIELNKINEIKLIRKILNIKFLDALKYYRKDIKALKEKNFDCLDDLQKKFENLPKKMKENFEYLKKKHFQTYGKILSRDEKYDQNHENNIIETIKTLKEKFIERENNGKNKNKNKNKNKKRKLFEIYRK